MRLTFRRLTVVAASLAGLLVIAMPAASQGDSPVHDADYPVQLTAPTPGLPPPGHPSGPPKEIPRHDPPFRPSSGNVADPVLQASAPTPAAAQALGNWEGLGEGYPGFSAGGWPPDPNMAVGPSHIVQWVNNALAIFNKQGAQVQAPVADSTFWGAGSTCYQGGGFSDPIVKYDRAADRWIVGEVAIPAFPGLFGQYAQCFAVSKTSDPTYVSDANGNNTSYYLWAYGFGANINDFDKIAVWSDAYYVTWNIFQNGSTFIGAEVCAWDRNAMLSGVHAPAFKCFQLSSTYAYLLPSDLDGATAPPAGSPNFFMNIDTSSGALNLWKFHVDSANFSNSTFTGPTSIAGVAPFTAPCFNNQTNQFSRDCIPQPGTTQKLDAFGGGLMYRVAYRNLGDHESLVANHTVTAGGNTGVRWYEVRSPNGAPTLHQQGTFAPDTDNRWMASIAMDKTGNIGVGYSVSSGATFPSIRYTGWEVGNPAGMLQAETSMVAGGGSQAGSNRWGDYSAMMTDPGDDCTFWYTQEYQAATNASPPNWNTRIGSFKFASCGSPTPDFTISATPSSQTVVQGAGTSYTVTVAPLNGFSGTVSFSASGLPTGATAGFSPSSVVGSGSSTLTVTTAGSTPTGSYTLTVTGTSGALVHSTTVTLVVVGPADFSISATPASRTVNQGSGTTYSVTISPVNGFAGTVSFGASGFGSGASASFSPTTVTGSGSTTMTVTTTAGAATGTFTVTITGTSGALSHSTTVTLVVSAAASGDFSISASPTSRTVTHGSSTTYTVTIGALNGFSGTVSFSVSGLPSHAHGSFSPSSVTGSGTSTLTVSTGTRTPTGSRTLTITGTSGGLSHSTNVTLVVN